MVRAIAGVLLAVFSMGCATAALSPVQSQALKEAQRFADQVTEDYHVQGVRVRVLQGTTSFDPDINWGRHLSIAAVDLGRRDLFEKMTLPLAWATVGYIPDSPTAAPYRRQYLYDLNRRAVELSVKYLGITTRAAVETNAQRIVKENDAFRKRGRQLGPYEVTPCEQLADLWSHFAIADPPPACEADWTRK